MAFGNLGKDRVRSIPLAQIAVNPAQPRTRFEEEALEQLAQSIKANGLLQPVTVRELSPGRFQLVAGERRCRACLMLGHSHISAIVKDCTPQQSAILALLENLQREDLDPFEQAEGLSRLVGYWGVTQEEAAAKLGLAQSTLANKLRLLKLSGEVREVIRQGGLTERHGRALLKLPEETVQLEAARTAAQKGFTVAQTERYVETLLEARVRKKPTRLFICKDVRLFLNTVDKAVRTMTEAGLAVQSARDEQEEFIQLTIRIPRKAGTMIKPA